MALNYSLNWRSFLMLFITISLIIGFAEINYLTKSHNESEIHSQLIEKLSENSNALVRFIGNAIYETYDFIYYKIFNIPMVFWLLVAINLFLIYVLRLENIKYIADNIFASFQINKTKSLKDHYSSFKSFICSSYGAISVAAISEIIILLKNYNTPGSIFWMCITILLLGLIQLCEIIINCYYIRNNKNQSCFVCILQYVVDKYSQNSKNQKLVKFFLGAIGIYTILMILTSFFSATMFQVEQIANFYLNNKGEYDTNAIYILMSVAAIGLLLASVQRFKPSLKINNMIISPILVCFIVVVCWFVGWHGDHAMQTIMRIIDDIPNPKAILPGVVSGLVISLARYIYKKNNDYKNDHWSIYEENDLTKATVMYTVESFFMMFLVAISGIAFYISANFITEISFFSINIKYFISLFLVIFALSIIINEAIYSKASLAHVFNLNDKKISYIVRVTMVIGVIMGFFKQTDTWVDIADHFSVIFLVINLAAFFFIMKDKQIFSECYQIAESQDEK